MSTTNSSIFGGGAAQAASNMPVEATRVATRRRRRSAARTSAFRRRRMSSRRRFPIEQLDVRERQGARAEEQYRPQPIGVVARVVNAIGGLRDSRRARAPGESEFGESARVEEILDDEISGVVHVRMKSLVLLVLQKAPADRPADFCKEDC